MSINQISTQSDPNGVINHVYMYFQVPFFIDELTVTDIDLGKEIPLLRRASRLVH